MGAVDPGQLLDGDDVGHVIHALAAVFLGDDHAEKAQLAHGPTGVIGEFLLLIQFPGHRLDHLFGKVPDRLAKDVLLHRKLEAKPHFDAPPRILVGKKTKPGGRGRSAPTPIRA